MSPAHFIFKILGKKLRIDRNNNGVSRHFICGRNRRKYGHVVYTKQDWLYAELQKKKMFEMHTLLIRRKSQLVVLLAFSTNSSYKMNENF